MMTADPAAAWVDGKRGRGEYILPGPLPSRIRVLAGERIGQMDDPSSCGDILIVQLLYRDQMFAETLFDGQRQDSGAVLVSLAAADEDRVGIEIDVLYPQRDEFHQPQPGTVKQFRHQPGLAGHLGEQFFHFRDRQDGGQPLPPFRSDGAAEVFDVLAQDIALQKENGIEGLILR